MTANILITRLKENCEDMTNMLSKHDFTTIFEPLFEVEKINPDKILDYTKYSFVIITSSNAIPTLLHSNIDKNIRIYTVGKITAQNLKNKGFSNIVSANSIDSASKKLKDLILKQEKPSYGLYFCGQITNFDFKEELENYGFKIENILSYKTQENEKFSESLLLFLQKEKFDYILIFSENSLKIFIKLAKKHNLLEYFKQSRILVLSEKILSEAKKLGFLNSQTFADFPILKNFYD